MLTKVSASNNNSNGIYVQGTNGSKYYGILKNFLNGSNAFGEAGLSSGNSSDTIAQDLQLSTGSLSTTGSFDTTWATIPSIPGWDYTKKGQQCTASGTCSNKNLTSDFTGNETYTFGSNIPKQTRPIKWNSTTSKFEYYGVDGVDYDSSKHIGEW